jgi:hypothetical protein
VFYGIVVVIIWGGWGKQWKAYVRWCLGWSLKPGQLWAHPACYSGVSRSLSSGVKRRGLEVDCKPPCNTAVKAMWIYTVTLLICLHGMQKDILSSPTTMLRLQFENVVLPTVLYGCEIGLLPKPLIDRGSLNAGCWGEYLDLCGWSNRRLEGITWGKVSYTVCC